MSIARTIRTIRLFASSRLLLTPLAAATIALLLPQERAFAQEREEPRRPERLGLQFEGVELRVERVDAEHVRVLLRQSSGEIDETTIELPGAPNETLGVRVRQVDERKNRATVEVLVGGEPMWSREIEVRRVPRLDARPDSARSFRDLLRERADRFRQRIEDCLRRLERRCNDRCPRRAPDARLM